jgi:RNA polymerase sigma-70 factor (ECF subfamily)
MREHDQERFTRLWTQAQPAIAGYVGALAPDAHAADDLLQDIAVALLRKFPDYDPQRPFIAWAMGIAKIQLLTLRRDRARAATRFRPETVESLAEVWQELLPEVDERRLALSECLQRVAGRGRELLTLRYEQALEPQEIAARLGLAGGAVRVALARVRATLHECIERRLHGAGP